MMNKINSWEEFCQRKSELNRRISDILTSYECDNKENLINDGAKIEFSSPYYRRKFIRYFSDEVEKIPKEEILNLYIAAKKYLPDVVKELAVQLKFEKYINTTVSLGRISKYIARCVGKGQIEFKFFYLLFGTEHAIKCTILHELCHTVHHNHKVCFWKLLEQKLKETKLIENNYDGWNKRLISDNGTMYVHNEYDGYDLYNLKPEIKIPQYIPSSYRHPDKYYHENESIFYSLKRKLECIILKKINECCTSSLMMAFICENYGYKTMLSFLKDYKHMPIEVIHGISSIFEYKNLTTFDYNDMMKFINSGYIFEYYQGSGKGKTKCCDAINEVSRQIKKTIIDNIT